MVSHWNLAQFFPVEEISKYVFACFQDTLFMGFIAIESGIHFYPEMLLSCKS